MTRRPSWKSRLRVCALAVALLLPLSSFAQPATDLEPHTVGAWGVELGDQKPEVRPGDDFYSFQNGGWLERTELGPAQPQAAYWRDLRLLAPRRLVALLQAAAQNKDASPDTPEGKAGAFYRAFMDDSTAEAKGLAPLRPELDAIRAATDRSRLAALIGAAEGPGTVRAPAVYGPPTGRGIFMLNIAQDQRRTDRYAVYVGQGGLLLPGPEYYVEAQFADTRQAYLAYIQNVLALLEWPDPAENARRILAYETRVAAASWSHERMRDPVATYNVLSVADLIRLAPGFDWRAFLRGAGLGDVDRVVIDARGAFPGIAAVFSETPLDVLQARQAFVAADRAAGNLGADLTTRAFEFHGTLLGNGAYLGGSRALRAEQAAEANIPGLVGAFYVAHYFSPEAKAQALEMAERMRTALEARLAQLAWMSPADRAVARQKLARMKIHVGYPDALDDYRALPLSDHDLFGNVAHAAAYNWQRLVRRLGQPFDGATWQLTPEYPDYNYDLTNNTVEIPAALLLPPFFDVKADAAVNYGAIGAQIGQMMVTAFTGQGSAYDADGRLRAWLAPEDTARYAALSRPLRAHYSAVEPIPGLHLKGDLLLDEAVGDLGGLLIALDAYHASLNGRAAEVIDGYSGDQRFFLGRAQMWRAKFNANFTRNQVATGYNAPPFMRVNGPLAQMDAWYAAFGVKPGDRMYVAPELRARIW